MRELWPDVKFWAGNKPAKYNRYVITIRPPNHRHRDHLSHPPAFASVNHSAGLRRTSPRGASVITAPTQVTCSPILSFADLIQNAALCRMALMNQHRKPL